MDERDEDFIDEVFEGYKEAKYLRDTYWDGLKRLVEDLELELKLAYEDADDDEICRKRRWRDDCTLTYAIDAFEEVKKIVCDRFEFLESLMGEYRSDICLHIDDGTIIRLDGEDFEGIRGRGFCGMDDEEVY